MNIFENPATKVIYTFKVQLATLVIDELVSRKLVQREAAKLLHTSQPRISDLLNAKLDRFSIETLIDFCLKLGLSIEQNFTKGYLSLNVQNPTIHHD